MVAITRCHQNSIDTLESTALHLPLHLLQISVLARMRAKSSSAVATALLVTLLFVGTRAITFKDVGATLRMSANERPELTKEALSDKVSHLPGWGSIQEDEFGMFAG